MPPLPEETLKNPSTSSSFAWCFSSHRRNSFADLKNVGFTSEPQNLEPRRWNPEPRTRFHNYSITKCPSSVIVGIHLARADRHGKDVRLWRDRAVVVVGIRARRVV